MGKDGNHRVLLGSDNRQTQLPLSLVSSCRLCSTKVGAWQHRQSHLLPLLAPHLNEFGEDSKSQTFLLRFHTGALLSLPWQTDQNRLRKQEAERKASNYLGLGTADIWGCVVQKPANRTVTARCYSLTVISCTWNNVDPSSGLPTCRFLSPALLGCIHPLILSVNTRYQVVQFICKANMLSVVHVSMAFTFLQMEEIDFCSSTFLALLCCL